jgi:hypothetical protein
MQRVGWVGGVKQEAKGGQAIKKREPSRSFNQRQTCVSRREVAKIDQIYRLLSPNEIIPMHKFKEKYAYSMYYSTCDDTIKDTMPSLQKDGTDLKMAPHYLQDMSMLLARILWKP